MHAFALRLSALFLAAVFFVAVATPVARAQDSQIEMVIEDQLAAFQRNDLAAAFAHAAPGIQQKFGSAENFGHMVRHGYPMIWRPQRHEYRGLAERPAGLFVKTVLFEDARGAQFEADYMMRERDGAWRIEGVTLRRLPGVSS
ncbi:MAG: DUF4864 domain-containing protein [Pseudomonadota bacterium]